MAVVFPKCVICERQAVGVVEIYDVQHNVGQDLTPICHRWVCMSDLVEGLVQDMRGVELKYALQAWTLPCPRCQGCGADLVSRLVSVSGRDVSDVTFDLHEGLRNVVPVTVSTS